MKKNLLKIVFLIMTLSLLLSLASCDFLSNLPFEIPGLTNKGDGGQTEELEGLVLIKGGVANFQIVYTKSSGISGKMSAENFVERLRKLNVEIGDAVSDTDAAAVAECEIIIGTNVQNRPEECIIGDKYLGEQGRAIKIVGKRIVIAGGTEALTKELFERYVKNEMKITTRTRIISDLAVNPEYFFEDRQKYLISSISVAGVDLSEFMLVVDTAGMSGYDASNISKFRNQLYELSGYYLESGNKANLDSYEHAFIVRHVADAGEKGFRAYVSGNNFIVECSYANSFNAAYYDFAYNSFYNMQDDIVFAEDYLYEDNVSIVYYEDFGAVGDGATCDFRALYDAHVYANQCGQKVMSKNSKAVYYISPSKFVHTIPVKTNVDFNGATILVDDEGDDAYANRNLKIFTLERDNPAVVFNEGRKLVGLDAYGNPKYEATGEIDDERFRDVTVPFSEITSRKWNPVTNKFDYTYDDDFKFEWLVGVLEAKSLVSITNSTHKDFIRHGANQSGGNNRNDVFVVDVDGTVDKSTPVAYGFDNVTKLEIFRADDTPIVFENGNFQNICCKTVAKTNFDCKYHAYYRGLCIFRTNVTVKNIKHTMVDEPDIGDYEATDYKEDELHSTYGSRHESYPYYGFFYIYNTYNFHAYDSELTGHTTYYEDKPATASTGGDIPDPVAMGSYDLIVEYSSHVYLDNVTQPCETGLGDQRYWGIMSSNGAKNMFFTGCEINRFDAHRGFWNAELVNTTIGHTFHIVGGGYFLADGVTKLTGEQFMASRGDYGATFRGDGIVKDCSFPAYYAYNTNRGGVQSSSTYSSVVIYNAGFSSGNSGFSDKNDNTKEHSGAYWLWDFGYTCYMPINIVIDNFQSSAATINVFNMLPNKVFNYNYDPNDVHAESVKYPYIRTESIVLKNMSKTINICGSTIDDANYSLINSIPVTTENYGDDYKAPEE